MGVTFHVEPFDVDALWPWQDQELPADEERATIMWRQLRSDVLAAAQAIEERDTLILQQAAELVALRRTAA